MTELAVLVPVLNRPQNVAPLVESFLAGCPDNSKLCFIVTFGDDAEIAAINECLDGRPDDGRVFVRADTRVTWPEKQNLGLSHVEARWYLLAADDIRFTPGWWDATAELRAAGFGVIGTNDLGNPRVQTGDLVIHPLVSAEYVKLGTMDDPTKLIHEGYHHWCCDDELLWTAKIRGQFAYCAGAVIEHLHPYWGKGQMDDTYRLGEAHSAEDVALCKSRAEHVLGLTLV